MSQDNNAAHLLNWNGTAQDERLSKSLLPDSFQVDERSMTDLLAFTAKYSELIQYYNLDDERDGNWSKFFKNNETVFLSLIMSTDLHSIEQHHKRLIRHLDNAPRAEEKLEALEGLVQQILEMAKQINDWYVHTLNMDRLNMTQSTELENELENAIKQQLAENFQHLLIYQEDLGFNTTGQFSPEEIRKHFHNNWFKRHEQIGARNIKLEGKESPDKIKEYTKKLRILFRTFYSVTAYILQVVPRYFEESIFEKSNHRPDVGMFIAFADMYGMMQERINNITEKHLDFYYYNILRQRQNGMTPDRANVYFEVGTHIELEALPKGTRISAGRDKQGVEHFYTTDNEVLLSQAKLDKLHTLFISKNPKIGIGSSYRVVTNIYAAEQANSRDGKGQPFINGEENWPTFGHEILELPKDEQQMGFAEVGWTIAAPILEMEEGHRIVSLRLRFVQNSMYTLNLLIKDISINQDISREDAFSRIFKNSLVAQFTTEEGWLEAHTCEILPPDEWGNPEILIVATVNAKAPSVVKYDRELHGEGYQAEAPMIKLTQRNEGSFFSYSFLKELELQCVTIDIDVREVRNLSLSTDIGVVYPNAPFFAFGAIPKVGSYLMIGKEEIFKKEVKDLQFNIEWHALPDDEKGLRGYYKDYDLGIENDHYEMTLSALNDGKFFPLEGDEPLVYKMFEPDEENPRGLHNKTTIANIDMEALNIKGNKNLVTTPQYSQEARDGYFKLEMRGPMPAFGHEHYADIYAKKIKYNNDPKRKGAEKLLPQQPIAPQMKSITMDYSARTEINVLSVGMINKGANTGEQLYHVHPFGIIPTFDKGRSSNRSLMPDYDDNAYLYMGIESLSPNNSVSFYFELKENINLFSDDAAKQQKPEVSWSYLSNDIWKDFSQTKILSDSTNGFNNSGIINLEIPRDVTNNNNILEGGYYWLRVTVKGEPHLLPRCLRTATQAVSVTWEDNGTNDVHLKEALPGNSMQRLDVSRSAVRGVFQPFPSFGGRPGETKHHFYTRTSERLRHKNRAISAWDYERLVLEKFPNIHQAKCVTHVGHEEHVPAGTVLMVVVPKIDKNSRSYYLPMVNYTVLNSIKEFLQQRSSPFVNIVVRNPIYERVKITAGVRFTKGKNNGTYLKKLNQDIVEYMCPWMLGQERELALGGSLVKDMILNFIEKREYVNFITKFSAVQVFPEDSVGFDLDDTAIHTTNSPVIRATTPWSILIPFEKNPIYFLDEETFQAPDKASISSMIIDGDFVMTEEKERDYDDYLSNKRRKRDLDTEEDED